MKLFFIFLLLLSFFLLGCSSSSSQITSCPASSPIVSEPEIILQEQYCPFNMTFSSSSFVQQDYFTLKPILPLLDAHICDDELLRLKNASGLCKIQRAEILRSAGRVDGRDSWQWRVDCVCSYEVQ